MQWMVRKTSTQNFDLYISQGFEQRERIKKKTEKSSNVDQ